MLAVDWFASQLVVGHALLAVSRHRSDAPRRRAVPPGVLLPLLLLLRHQLLLAVPLARLLRPLRLVERRVTQRAGVLWSAEVIEHCKSETLFWLFRWAAANLTDLGQQLGMGNHGGTPKM